MLQPTKFGQHRNSHQSIFFILMKMFTIISILACVQVNVVHGIQSSVLADLKQVEQASSPRITNKVKRAQEVVMFGNQQNRLSDHNNYVRADKRDIPNGPLPDEQNTFDKDEIEEPVAMASINPVPNYSHLSSLRDRYYYRPDIYDTELYEDRQKRSTIKRMPVKRSARIFRSFSNDRSRTKRESPLSQIDPEDLLSILRTWEEDPQQHRKHLSNWRNTLRNEKEYEPYSKDILNDIENDDSIENEEWLDGPVPLHHFTVKPRFYPPYNSNLIPNRQSRKYKNNPDNEYARVLSQLAANNGRLDQHASSQRRYLF